MRSGLASRARIGAATALVAIAAAACTPAATKQTPTGSSLGVHTGGPAAVRDFESWSGEKVRYVLDYTPRGSWDDITSPSWQTSQWEADRANHRLVLSVGMTPDNTGDLASGANGAYDGYYRKLAQNLVAHHLGNTIVRLGWEFNGDWFRWGIVKGDDASSRAAAANFAATWRHAVNAMRSVPGSAFLFDWCVNNGYSRIPAEAAYPGDAYVDYVGIDAYDTVWGPYGSNVADPAERWKITAGGDHGLNFWAGFAGAHGKRLSLPEWGLWGGDHGGGDDAAYISYMHSWITAHHVGYATYFNDLDAQINTGRFPQAAAMYKALF